MARLERGFDLVTDEVTVLSKFDGEFEGHPYYKVNVGGVGWGFNVSCSPEVYNMVEEGKSYQFEGHFNTFDNKSSMKFNGVLPIK